MKAHEPRPEFPTVCIACGQLMPCDALTYQGALVRLLRFTHSVMSSSGKGLCSFNDLRYAETIATGAVPGGYGDETDPWPEETARAREVARTAS